MPLNAPLEHILPPSSSSWTRPNGLSLVTSNSLVTGLADDQWHPQNGFSVDRMMTGETLLNAFSVDRMMTHETLRNGDSVDQMTGKICKMCSQVTRCLARTPGMQSMLIGWLVETRRMCSLVTWLRAGMAESVLWWPAENTRIHSLVTGWSAESVLWWPDGNWRVRSLVTGWPAVMAESVFGDRLESQNLFSGDRRQPPCTDKIVRVCCLLPSFLLCSASPSPTRSSFSLISASSLLLLAAVSRSKRLLSQRIGDLFLYPFLLVY